MKVDNRKLFGIKKTLYQTPKPSMNPTIKSTKPNRIAKSECVQARLRVESKKAEAFKIVRHVNLA
jgi:hypothetical protein